MTTTLGCDRSDLAPLRAAIDANRAELCDALGLRADGHRYFCPFCQDDGHPHADGDFSIEAGFFCHKCQWKGDGFNLVQGVKDCDFVTALDFMRSVYNFQDGVTPTPPTAPTIQPPRKPTRVHPTSDAAAKAAAWGLSQQTEHEWTETRRDIYHDAAGKEVGAVLRFDRADGAKDEQGKPLKTYRPIHAVPGGWQTGDPEGLWPLLNLQGIRGGVGSVYICEGEKAAKAGIGIGLICTTSAHGSKSPQKTDWQPLRGRDLILLPDQDAAGKKYADAVAELATAAGAKSIRIVELPGLPPKGDLHDFIMLRPGQSTETIQAEIESLSNNTPVWTRPARTATATPQRQSSTPSTSSTIARAIIPLPSHTTPIIDSASIIFPLLSKCRTAFWRGGRVCEIIEDGGQTGIDPIRPEAFRSRIESLGTVGAWIKSDNGKMVFSPKRASKEDCIALLATLQAAELLPPIESVYAAPVLIEDAGSVHRLGRGYHEAGGGCLVTGGDASSPSMSVQEAAESLKALLADFQFVTSADHTRALAFLITPSLVFGHFLRGPCPIFVAEADQSQTGKGYLCRAVCKLYGENASIVAQRTGGVGGFDESLQERMVSGRPFILVDNLRGHIDSQYIEATLTAGGRIGCRIPHRGEIHVDARRFLFSATSNGIKSTTDFANRACIIRLRKHPHGYQWHSWVEGGLWEHIEANASRYQSAVHTIVEEWYKAGAHRTPGMNHDFRDWAGAAAAIINMAWPTATPLLEGHREAQERTANPSLSWLREVALAVAKAGRGGEELSATAIAELCSERGIEIPGLRDGTDSGKAAKLVGYTLQRCLNDNGIATVEDHTVRVIKVETKRDDGAGYYPSKRYVFTAPHNQPDDGDHSNHSKDPITPKTFGDSPISNVPLTVVTVVPPVGEPMIADAVRPASDTSVESGTHAEGGSENTAPVKPATEDVLEAIPPDPEDPPSADHR